jgi:hypothetical protein
MDTKYYIEWREQSQKWIVEHRGQIQAWFDTKAEAEAWGRSAYPGKGHESERVQVRENSPRGAKPGQWM